MSLQRAFLLTPIFVAILLLTTQLGLPFLPLKTDLFAAILLSSLTLVAGLILFVCRGAIRTPSTWYFVGAPTICVAGVYGVALFLESSAARTVLTLVSTTLVTLFVSLVVTYLHTPQRYRAHSIEYVSLVLNLTSLYLWAIVGFASVLFLQLSPLLLALIFFCLMTFVGWGALWVSKVEGPRALWLGMIGALLVTEGFALITFLPTSYLTSAAFVALLFYVLIGLIRAHALKKLRRLIVVRYVGIATLLTVLMILTSRWF